jgi:hypothetical protein
LLLAGIGSRRTPPRIRALPTRRDWTTAETCRHSCRPCHHHQHPFASIPPRLHVFHYCSCRPEIDAGRPRSAHLEGRNWWLPTEPARHCGVRSMSSTSTIPYFLPPAAPPANLGYLKVALQGGRFQSFCLRCCFQAAVRWSVRTWPFVGTVSCQEKQEKTGTLCGSLAYDECGRMIRLSNGNRCLSLKDNL